MKAIYVAGRENGSQAKLARRRVSSVMNGPPIVISIHALLDDALMLMTRSGLRHLVVIDDAGRCAGMLSDRTIASAWASDYDALAKRTVASVLDAEPAIVHCDGVVIDAAVMMRRCGVDAVAVVEPDGSPIGVITGGDLVALLAA